MNIRSIVFVALLILLSVSTYAQSKSAPKGKNVPVAEFYPGGQDSMYAFIDRQLKYPPTAKRNRMQGECIVDLKLNEQGKIESVLLIKNIGGGTGEEALRVAKMLKFKAPGYKLQTNLPICFRL